MNTSKYISLVQLNVRGHSSVEGLLALCPDHIVTLNSIESIKSALHMTLVPLPLEYIM